MTEDFLLEGTEEALPEDGLERLIALCEIMVSMEERVAAIEEQLAVAKERLLRYQRVEVPELAKELGGLTSLKLSSGIEIEIKEEVTASIPPAAKPLALRWLVENGFAGLVKTKVVAAFERGDHEGAVTLAKSLAEEHDDVLLDESVHAATLKSFVKERLEAGETLPEELFNVGAYSWAKTKLPKSKRK